jgi:hypothetical protein
MPSVISNLAIALLAMQAMAGPAPPASAHGHRRHHARHARRACRAKSSASASAAAGNGTTVPIYVSENGTSLIEASSVSQIGNEYVATGKSLGLLPWTPADGQVLAVLHQAYLLLYPSLSTLMRWTLFRGSSPLLFPRLLPTKVWWISASL